MLSIGDFARYDRVSVRMLRHYYSIGLLRPAYVDPVSRVPLLPGEATLRPEPAYHPAPTHPPRRIRPLVITDR
jgi:hypothetical protein